MIPILPVALIEMLEAPVPLIIGLTEAEYKMIWIDELLDEEEIENKLWVHLKLEQAADGQYRTIEIENLNDHLDSCSDQSISDPHTCSFGGIEKAIIS
jgi:hypothetical protein